MKWQKRFGLLGSRHGEDKASRDLCRMGTSPANTRTDLLRPYIPPAPRKGDLFSGESPLEACWCCFPWSPFQGVAMSGRSFWGKVRDMGNRVRSWDWGRQHPCQVTWGSELGCSFSRSLAWEPVRLWATHAKGSIEWVQPDARVASLRA